MGREKDSPEAEVDASAEYTAEGEVFGDEANAQVRRYLLPPPLKDLELQCPEYTKRRRTRTLMGNHPSM